MLDRLARKTYVQFGQIAPQRANAGAPVQPIRHRALFAEVRIHGDAAMSRPGQFSSKVISALPLHMSRTSGEEEHCRSSRIQLEDFRQIGSVQCPERHAPAIAVGRRPRVRESGEQEETMDPRTQ